MAAELDLNAVVMFDMTTAFRNVMGTRQTVMREITIEVSAGTLEAAQALTGAGASATVRAALDEMHRRHAAKELISLRGKVKFADSWQELRGK